jgi:hypothetical protein
MSAVPVGPIFSFFVTDLTPLTRSQVGERWLRWYLDALELGQLRG